jgi:hypothetical protein
MVSNSNYQVFEIICDDELLIQKTIKIFNDTYSTNFKLVEYVLDEVNFAKIGGSNIKLSDVFSLGCMYTRQQCNVRY